MHLQSLLEENGFSKHESSVYLALLEIDEGVASIIAKRSGLKRTTCYSNLKTLMNKGIVRSYTKRNIQYFSAKNPELVIEEINQKAKKLLDAIPEFKTLMHMPPSSQMKVEYFEGKQGLIDMMEGTLTSKDKMIYGVANIEQATNTLTEYYPSYIKRRVALKIYGHVIVNYSPVGLHFKKWQKKEFRECHLVPKELFPFENEINVYDDKTMIISHPNMTGVLIKNEFISNTFKSMIKMNFEYAKIIEKQILTKTDLEYLNNNEEYRELFS